MCSSRDPLSLARCAIAPPRAVPHLLEDSLPALYIKDRLRSFTTEAPLDLDLGAGETQMEQAAAKRGYVRS